MVTNLRPELTDHLTQRLTAFGEGFRHNLALLGPPGSGKTFQLHQLLAHHPPGLSVVYCPLYRESCRSFLQRLLGAILQAAPELPQTAAAARQVEGLLARRLYGEAFARALDLIPVFMNERRKPTLLILDEFLFLEELGLGHAFHELGKRVMTWPTVLFILASSSEHRARTILRERLQLLFGQFELVRLGALDPRQAAAWVQQELRGTRGAKAMAPFLLQWLDGYPWYLSVFLKRLKELAALGKTPEVGEALFLQTAWDLVGSAEGTLHHWCASRMEALAAGRAGARAVDALIQIAEGARTATELGTRVGRGGLSEALQLLLEQDAAQRNGTCWMVPDPILRCWLSTVLSPQRAGARPDGMEARQRFEHHLRALWTRWVQTHELSFSERVVELFGRFCDDTVLLNSKTGRLPKFEAIRTVCPDAQGSDVYLIADGQGKRWCAAVRSAPADEHAIAGFDAFCRAQTPKPSRKVVVMSAGMDQHVRLLAKAANMWVWEPAELHLLMDLYGHP
ncbi:MAG: orc1/cdc6 family replication initiation protein [Candidatus Omnitrophica bacterium]|nr:orc1/cdc6 family replication initiation protein [Candidatus Omnitrophota bacterium]